jgi:hypothetical protein
MSRNSSIGIAKGYGLDGRDSIPDSGNIFPFSTKSKPALGTNQSPIQWVPGVKKASRETK